jgi:hypothetical protein
MQQGEMGGIHELTRRLTKRSTNRIGGTGQLRPLSPPPPESCFRSPRPIHGGKPTVSTGRGLSRPAGEKKKLHQERTRLDPSNRVQTLVECARPRPGHPLRLAGNKGEAEGTGTQRFGRAQTTIHHPPSSILRHHPGTARAMHAVDDNKDVAEKLGPVDNTQLGAWDGLRGISRPEGRGCPVFAVC